VRPLNGQDDVCRDRSALQAHAGLSPSQSRYNVCSTDPIDVVTEEGGNVTTSASAGAWSYASSVCDALSRFCARRVVCWSTFSLALPFALSVPQPIAPLLFADFPTTSNQYSSAFLRGFGE
jgi:hypothetical protein